MKTLSLAIPKRGQYILTDDWEIDFSSSRYNDPEWFIDRWVQRGATRVGKYLVAIPAGVVFTLTSIQLTQYRDSVAIKFHKKYNGKNSGFYDCSLTFTTSFFEQGVPARLLEGDELDELVRERK